MNIRRTLSLAVATAAVVPAFCLTAAPAFAAAPTAADETARPTYDELKKAAEDADAAYEKASADKKTGLEKLKELFDALDHDDTNPLRAAYLVADKAYTTAKDDRKAADDAVTAAEEKLKSADEADKAAAQTELDTARTAAETAAATERDAEAERDKAREAIVDVRVKASRDYNGLTNAEQKAAEDKKNAHAALDAARECVRTDDLTVLAKGLPQKIVAGTTTDFTVTVANSTDRTLTVRPLMMFRLDATNDRQHFMTVQWSRDGAPWQELDQMEEHPTTLESMKPGSSTDLHLRLTLVDNTPAMKAWGLLAGDAGDVYNPCVLGPMKRYDFSVLTAGSETPAPGDAEPGEVPDKDRPTPGDTPETDTPKDTPQGGTSGKPVQDAADERSGDLASTGSSNVVPTAAIAAGALALGAGAVVIARRRRANS
ncbi:LPXTG cell wall anchor domain-containing protein [Streptomyces sp. NPDC016845]|uniref:LPXTG cell wall anchor domain-containing protein n=1 Tax=Streptomyces sp. NPDC016845 TaxID=3364972 RepID=UPI0037B66FB1